jgi:signal peptidase II
MKRIPLMVIMAITIALDQWTKQLARVSLASAAPRRIGGILTLLYAENTGAFLSLGANLPPQTRSLIFSGVVAIALGIGIYALMTNRIGGSADSIAVAFILGGGIGNLIDRVFRGGRVTDFLYMSAGPLHTGVFNVADIAITGGVIWLLITWFLQRRTTSQVV